MRFAVPVGVAAAAVQVIGPLRWPVPVPGWAAENNVETFATANQVLGNLVGYLLTSAWTALVLMALGARFAVGCSSRSAAPRSSSSFRGVFPFSALPVVDLADFVGYVLWSVWSLIFAAALVRRGARQPSRA